MAVDAKPHSENKYTTTLNAGDLMEETKKKPRIQIIDAARGLAVTLMLIHHAAFNIYYFLDGPKWPYQSDVIDILRWIFIGVFMVVSGISSRFSRGNIQRGAIVLLLGVFITYISIRVLEMPIYFGILSVLGTIMIFYGATRKLWDKIPLVPAIVLYTALVIISTWARHTLTLTTDIAAINDILFALGWRQPDYYTYDYETILPWIFVFLLGTRIGEPIKDGKFPKWFYDAKFPFFPFVGRHALVIYMAHQPILYGITMLIVYLRG